MTWNYRVIERDVLGSSEKSVGIHEVYYDEQGRVTAWSENAVAVTAYSAEGLAEEMDLMREVLDKPVLIEGDLLREIADRKTTNQSEAEE